MEKGRKTKQTGETVNTDGVPHNAGMYTLQQKAPPRSQDTSCVELTGPRESTIPETITPVEWKQIEHVGGALLRDEHVFVIRKLI